MWSIHKLAVFLLLARLSQDVFLLPLIPFIEQVGITLLVKLLYDLCDSLTILSYNGESIIQLAVCV